MPAEVERLRALADDVKLGPSTGAIVAAAKARGIPSLRLNRESLVQLGYSAKAHRICTAETDQTSAIAEQIAQDKELTRTLLHAAGVPVPVGRPVKDADDAWAAAEELGLPVVVKPQYGNHGRGVATDLRTREQVLAAYQAAREESSYIMVETFIPGDDHRLLVIGGKLVAAALREPAQVIGDGRQTIRQLVDEVNKDPRRGDGHATVLTKIKLDAIGRAVLAEQGCTPDSVPAAGQKCSSAATATSAPAARRPTSPTACTPKWPRGPSRRPAWSGWTSPASTWSHRHLQAAGGAARRHRRSQRRAGPADAPAAVGRQAPAGGRGDRRFALSAP